MSLLVFQLPLAELETKLNADTLSQQDVSRSSRRRAGRRRG